MSSAALAVTGFGRTGRWVTNGASVSGDFVEVPITSELTPQPERDSVVAVLQYANAGQTLPARRGKHLLLETSLEQLGFLTDAIVAGSSFSQHILSPWFSLFSQVGMHRPPSPLAAHEHETLDWDAFIAAPPARPSGTLTVSLTFAGRTKPIEIEDPWD